MAIGLERVSGIYLIRNSVNGKIYIGSAENLGRRRREHWKELRNREHCNAHLQAAWSKYGEEEFSFEVLERCSDLLKREDHWLYQYGLPNSEIGYNIRKKASSNAGLKHSPETKVMLSEIQHAHRQTPEGRKTLLIACKAGGEATLASGKSLAALQKATMANKMGQGRSVLQALKASIGMKKKHQKNRDRKVK